VKTHRPAKPARPKATTTGKDARDGAKALRTREKELAAIEKFRVEKGITTKRLITAPPPVILPQSEKDKREVLMALGHDAKGKCPTGVDWRAFHEHTENLVHVPTDQYMANRAACLRATSYINFHSAKVALAARASCGPWSCGWWCCGKNLKANQWTDLRRAIEILKASDRDPNGWEMAYRAHAYATNVAWAREWPKWEDLWKFYEKNPNLLPDTINVQWEWCDGEWKHDPKDRDALLEKLQVVLFGRHPKGVGKPVDAPYHHLLNDYPVKSWETFPKDEVSPTWTPKVAAALLVLFGTVKEGSTLKKETHRAREAWDLGSELNHRVRPKIR
jgi:hypothetical protein